MLIEFTLVFEHQDHEVWLEKHFSGDVPPDILSASIELDGSSFKAGGTSWYPESNEMWISLKDHRTYQTEKEFWDRTHRYISNGWRVNEDNSAFITRRMLLLEEVDGINREFAGS